MKDSILIDAREFISVVRASEITKYSNDYIGQLCREGKIAARMVGRTWFIDRESLSVYKNSVDAAFAGQGKQKEAILPKGSVESNMIDGREYVEVAKAAEMTKYSKDYIGQLCREGKIAARMVGRTWLIDRESLATYKSSVDSFFAGHGKQKEPVLPRVVVESKMVAKSTVMFVEKQKESLARNASVTYMPDTGATLPVLQKKYDASVAVTHVPNSDQRIVYRESRKSSPMRTAFTVVAIALVLVSGSVAFLRISNRSGQGHVAVEMMAPNTASVGSIIYAIEDFFRRVFNMESRSLATNDVEKPPPNPGGLAIVPSSNSKAQDELIKQKIRGSFSDEVRVAPDESGTAGVITPVFKKATGDNFVYVLVPVAEQANNQ
ncbi:MAG: helix-turn-helix domain-containing protein [Patescibacteria group bacterium]